MKLRVACIQNNASANPEKNIKAFQPAISRAIRKGARLIAFPENFCFRGPASLLEASARVLTPALLDFFSEMARRHRAAFLLGSVSEISPVKNKFFNTSFLISEKGKIIAKYRKIHLFDNQLKGAAVKESRHILRGEKKAVTASLLGFKAGLSICYDLRFPELYRDLSRQGASVLFIPSNFTEKTGAAHWEILVRARAIENQAFVIAPGLVGVHPENGIRSFGTSLIVDPWGRVLARGSRQHPEVLIADLDFSFLKSLKRAFPVLTHRRLS